MLGSLKIQNYKCIKDESFNFKTLNIITGKNSTGKSSIIQSILLLSQLGERSNHVLSDVIKHYLDFSSVRNKYINAKSITLTASLKDKTQGTLIMDLDSGKPSRSDLNLHYDENLFYLSANRIGQQEIAEYNLDSKMDGTGENMYGFFEQNKSKSILPALCRFKESTTLSYQLSQWLSYIIDIQAELKTEKITSTQVKVSFSADGIDNINPFNLGAGNSYLAKILIMCLMAKQDHIILIENPEIHLHPKAQSKLGEFFTFVSNAGVQLILETHCEHLINQICYQVYNDNFSANDVVIYYKDSVESPFTTVGINESGYYVDDHDKVISFPSGFFDASLANLLEMG